MLFSFVAAPSVNRISTSIYIPPDRILVFFCEPNEHLSQTTDLWCEHQKKDSTTFHLSIQRGRVFNAQEKASTRNSVSLAISAIPVIDNQNEPTTLFPTHQSLNPSKKRQTIQIPSPSKMGFWNDGMSSYSGGGHHSSSRHSYYSSSRARPRAGYINRMYNKLRRFLRDLYYYARRHPVKVFMLVIMPLLTGGALHKLLAQFGIRLPPGLLKAFGGPPGGYPKGYRSGGEYQRYSVRGEGSGIGNSVEGLMGLAKIFM